MPSVSRYIIHALSLAALLQFYFAINQTIRLASRDIETFTLTRYFL